MGAGKSRKKKVLLPAKPACAQEEKRDGAGDAGRRSAAAWSRGSAVGREEESIDSVSRSGLLAGSWIKRPRSEPRRCGQSIEAWKAEDGGNIGRSGGTDSFCGKGIAEGS